MLTTLIVVKKLQAIRKISKLSVLCQFHYLNRQGITRKKYEEKGDSKRNDKKENSKWI